MTDLFSSQLLTWFDVERRVFLKTKRLSQLPGCISKVSVYPTTVEVVLSKLEAKSDAKKELLKWFSPSEIAEKGDDLQIYLKIGDRALDVVFDPEPGTFTPQPLLPLWERLVYQSSQGGLDFEPPPALDQSVALHAFHSFKGGVGRTTALMTFAAAYGRTLGKKVLIIDADIEAPGVTFWLDPNERGTVSFSGLLEALHSPPSSIDEVVEYFAKEVAKSTHTCEGNELFILPAFCSNLELLNARIAPQHLIRSAATRWLLGTVFHKLAKMLGAEAVFVDLRAGLSELSSPILFDARFKRFLVTTLAEQSIAGVELTLEMMKRARNALPDSSLRRHPSVIYSMLTEQMKESPAFLSARERLENSYGITSQSAQGDGLDSDNLATELSYFEAMFSPELMSIRDLNSAYSVVQNTKLFEIGLSWYRSPPKLPEPPPTEARLDAEAEALGKSADARIFAEELLPKGFLTTEALRNLGRAFLHEIPNAVLIGAKGSGKTFGYLQIALSITWEKFVLQLGLGGESQQNVEIMPILRSTQLNDAISNSVRDIFEEVQKKFYPPGRSLASGGWLKFSDISDLISEELKKGSVHSADWAAFWVTILAKSLNSDAQNLNDLNQFIAERGRRIVFLIDGVEDILKDVEKNAVERAAVEAIIDLPNRIRDIRNPSIGVLAYLREDYVKTVKTQNFGQFQSRYSKFQLNWSPREFLQLVYWLCADSGVVGATKAKVDSMSTTELVEALQNLWGKKLGREDAAEAYSARWVYAALSDLRGQLQARDIVRFLSLAANQAKSKRLGIWLDRVLPPAALRAALPLLSRQKVLEAVEEYPALKEWQTALAGVNTDKKRIPFAPEDMKLEGVLRQRLLEIGVIYEDVDKADAERIYVPEIYREGLGIGSKAGARPRVQALLQRSLGSLPF